MDKLDPRNAIFVYPDPVTTPEMLTGSAFLYFDKPLVVTLPPQVITHGSFEMLNLVNERAPTWSSSIYGLLSMWRRQQDGFRDCMDMLSPLKGKKLNVVWTTYNSNRVALDKSQQLIEAAGYALEEAGEFIDPVNAAGEIVRHIFLEAYLENNEDVNALFTYCDNLFHTENVPSLLTKGYFLRAPFVSAIAQSDVSLLLTNQRLLPLFDALPIEPENRNKDWRSFQDVIAWELFRRIVSPSLDPLTPDKVELICKMLDERHGAIDSMKGRCNTLAYDIEASTKESELDRVLEKIVRSASSEISDLLAIDKKATQDFVTELLGDEKTWLAFSAAITGLVVGGVSLTAGAAIASFANIGAKAFKEASKRHQRLKSSEFALMYFLNNS